MHRFKTSEWKLFKQAVFFSVSLFLIFAALIWQGEVGANIYEKPKAEIVRQFSDKGDKQIEKLKIVLPEAPSKSPLANLSSSEKIAFTSNRSGNFEIYVMTSSGSEVTQLTNDPAEDYAPAWSPDGAQICFVSRRDGNDEIYLMSGDGSWTTRLTHQFSEDTEPAWSPDGSKIAFTSKRDGDFELFLIDLTTKSVSQLTFNEASDRKPVWSPDGLQLAFTSDRDGDDEIFLIPATGGEQTQITFNTETDFSPVWSPDGDTILYFTEISDGFEIHSYAFASRSPALSQRHNIPAKQASWSPDGTKIAFTENRNGNNEIFIMNADGSDLTSVTGNPAHDSDPAWQPATLKTNNKNLLSPAVTILDFPGTGVGAIPDQTGSGCQRPGTPLDMLFNVSGATGNVQTVEVTTTFSPAHSYAGDIVATLIAPGGTRSLDLFGYTLATTATSAGDSSDLAGPYIFSDSATGTHWWTAAGIAGATVPIPAGTYRTTQRGGAGVPNPSAVTSLNAVFGGMTPAQTNGTWTLRLTDGCAADTGAVSAANLRLGFACASAPNGLVSWWAGNNNALDYQGVNQGSLNGNTTYAAGKVQQAFDFDGDEDYVSIPDNDTLDVQDEDFSIDAWVNLRSNRLHHIAGKDDCNANSYALLVNEQNKPVFRVITSSGEEFIEAPNPIALNAWHHLAATREGANLNIYINGALAATQVLSGNLAANDVPFTIGSRAPENSCGMNANAGTDGLVDEVDVYDRALTLSDVQAIYTADSAGKCQPVLQLSIDPNPVMGGRPATGTFTLANAAPAGGATVTLTSADTSIATVPLSLFIAEGQTSATFPITVPPRNTDTFVNITGSYNSLSKTTSLFVSRSLPDLRVTGVTAPAEVSTANAFDVIWTDFNDGTLATANNWSDEVFFSLNNQLDAGDRSLGRFAFNGVLDPGQSGSLTNSVAIPPSSITADGDYFLIVRADALNNINEGSFENNNIFVKPIRVLRRAPDLQVSVVTSPAEIGTTTPFSVSWTDKNFGVAPASPGWNDQVYFSRDNMIGSDVLLGTLDFSGTLAPDGTLERELGNLTIPPSAITATGDYYIYIRTDSGNAVDEGGGASESNNVTFRQIRVNLVAPDLQVTATSAAPETETDQDFEISWTLANTGTARANPIWTDCLYFSLDNQVGADTNVGCFQFSPGLDPQQTAERIQNLRIPISAVPQTGNYFYYVTTDVGDNVDEGAGGNNNNRSAFRPLRVRRTPRPDLTVPSIVAPDTAFFDQGIQVQWTVTNNGSGSTNSSQWNDRIYLSTDTTISTDDRDLGGAQNVSYLNSGESYIAAVDVTLPRGLFGNLFLIVKTDVSSSVAEDNEANNTRVKSINVLVPPLPDLRVPFVQAPEEGFAGQTVLLNWRVENQGTGGMTPQQTNWSDRVYLSQDTVFSPATDRLIASRPNTAGALAQNAGYTVNGFSATLPNNIIGDWYVFVVTDADNQIYEFTGENNNFNYDAQQPGSPMTIRATPPDLTILQPVSAPVNAAAGTEIATSFTVKNQGAFDAGPAWADKIYLSGDNVLDPTIDFDLGTFSRPNPLGAGLEYTINANVRLPDCLAGTFYLFAVTDTGNQIFEFDPKIDGEANNASPPRAIQITNSPPDLQVFSVSNQSNGTAGQPVQIDWIVTNNGTGATLTGDWYDRVLLSSSPVFGNGNFIQLGSFLRSGAPLVPGASYSRSVNATLPAGLQGVWYVFVATDQTNFVQECSGENNNSLGSPTTLTVVNPNYSNQPDLRVNDFSATPANGFPGETIFVQWTGANNGNQALPASNWNDTVYFSNDPTLSPNDTPVGGALISQALPVGGTYQAQAQVTLPNVTPGNYFLIVSADSDNYVFEGNFENNNTNSRSVGINAPVVDLQVTSTIIPSTAVAGQNMSVSFTVTNVSPEITFASGWTDYVVLSRDLIIDTTDRVIANFGHTGGLGAGNSYTVTGEALVPSGLTGEYNVFVIADRNNQVFESSETNNTSMPTIVTLSLAPPADLVVQTINAPAAQVVPGEEAVFSWTILNAGSNTAPGSWSDSVYLSTDQTWDINDVFIGQRVQNGPLAPAASYNGTLTATLPAMNLGVYYVIVRTDTRNLVRELIESNNTQASTSTTTVDVTELQLGVPLATTLVTNQERFYKVNVPASETLLVTLNGETGASNELYTRFGQMVSRRQYDFLFTRPYEADQETLVPTTVAGTYYNLARADFVPASVAEQNTPGKKEENSLAQNVTIKAEVLPFDVRRVSPATAGNGGYAALTVEGAKFQPATTVKLVRQENEIIPSNSRAETARLAAVFDLRGKPAGSYDVVVRNPDGQTKTLTNGFTIVQGGNHDISVKVTGPDRVRPDTYGRFTVSVQNNGLNDALLTQLFIFVPANANYRLSREGEIQANPADLPPGLNIDDIPIHTETENGKSIPIMIPLLKRGKTLNINIDVQPPPGSTTFPVRGSILPPMLALDSTELNRSAGDAPSVGNCLYEVVKTIFSEVLAPKLTRLIGGICAEQVADFMLEQVSLLSDAVFYGAVTDQPEEVVKWQTLTSLGLSTLRVVAVCTVASLPPTRALLLIKDIADTVYLGWQAYQNIETLGDCAEALSKYDDELTTSVLRPSDPNDKVGPSGYGALKFVAARQVLNYRINFENMPTATAYAQKIRITDQLPNTLDARTLRLKEVGFGNYRFEVPDNRAFYQTRAPLGADLGNLLVDISAGLDIAAGRVTWTLTAIDPVTGEQPLDPNRGLLPPNGAENLGQGYVIFTVQPKTTATTGTLINNNATIVFDTEPPIITNTVSNTLDAAAPVTSVAALPGSSVPVFEVQWNGTDDVNGSGLESYDVWVSENNGVYQSFISGTTQTSAQFTGKFGRTYRFYSIARDNAGNVEMPPENPDAVTTVVGGAFESDVAPRPNGNNDGTINNDDVSQVRRFVARLDGDYLYNEIQRADAAPLDSRGDSRLSIADVIQSRRFALGLDTVVSAAGPEVLSRVGTNSPNAVSAPHEIRPVRINRIGNKLLLGVELDALGDEVGVGFTLNFDPNVLSNPSNINLGSGAAGAILTVNNTEANQGRIGILIDKAPNQPFAAGINQILTLEFDIASMAPTTTNVNISGSLIDSEIVNSSAEVLTGIFSAAEISLSGPTAAHVTIGGRVINNQGSGLGNVLVTLTEQTGNIRQIRTNSFGSYRFENVEVGRVYIISVHHKKYQFIQPSITVNVLDALDALNFEASPD